MKITVKGQVTIPKEMRDRYGLAPDTEVEFSAGKEGLLIRPAANRRKKMEDWIASARGCATSGLRTDEIMDLTRREK